MRAFQRQHRAPLGRGRTNGLQRGRKAALHAWLPILLSLSMWAGPADRFDAVEIRTTKLSDSVHMLEGMGGNIGVSAGADGVLMIDTQFAPLAERIEAAIAALGHGAPSIIVNTHLHGDHTGGNVHFAGLGTVLAHSNVRARMVDAGTAAGLPSMTFDDRVRLHLNGDEIDIIHMPKGHTDGDAVVWFKESGVAHLGDHFFNGAFPYVDVGNGGSVDGLLANLRRIQDMLPAATTLIPGHGSLADLDALAVAIDVIAESQATVRQAVADNTLPELKRDGFGRWSDWGTGFISEARWIDIIVQSDAAGE